MKTKLPNVHLTSISLVENCLKDNATCSIDKFLCINFKPNEYLDSLDHAIVNIFYSFYLNNKTHIKLSELVEILNVYREIDSEVTIEKVLNSIEKIRFIDVVVGNEQTQFETFLLPMNVYSYTNEDGSKKYSYELFRRSILCVCVDTVKKSLNDMQANAEKLQADELVEEVIDVQE